MQIFCINSSVIYYANEYSLGYLNERTQLKNDTFIKILPSNQYLDIETNKYKSTRVYFEKLDFKYKANFLFFLTISALSVNLLIPIILYSSK